MEETIFYEGIWERLRFADLLRLCRTSRDFREECSTPWGNEALRKKSLENLYYRSTISLGEGYLTIDRTDPLDPTDSIYTVGLKFSSADDIANMIDRIENPRSEWRREPLVGGLNIMQNMGFLFLRNDDDASSMVTRVPTNITLAILNRAKEIIESGEREDTYIYIYKDGTGVEITDEGVEDFFPGLPYQTHSLYDRP